MARRFRYKVEVFFKEIVLDGPLGKTKYHDIRIEFQEMGSLHVHLYEFSMHQTFRMKLST